MASRRKIGLIYEYNENWIGGTYYIENLIAALNRLPQTEKPELYIFTKKEEDFEALQNKVSYDFLNKKSIKKQLGFVKKIANAISIKLFKSSIFSTKVGGVDLVFPALNEGKFKDNPQFISWIPDFQDHYLPEFFSEEEIAIRKKYQGKILERSKYIVFSSASVQNDFNTIYPSNTLRQFVLRFAVTHPIINDSFLAQQKYKLPKTYFICSNQFWVHKNHTVIFKAVHELKKRNQEVCIVFTGKQNDYRHPEYFESLMKLAEESGLTENLFFLGFISRADQLSLIQGSLAVIQPSLFEGWSTVIEDAKSIGARVIASNLSVHQEQLQNYTGKLFFEPQDENELADKIGEYSKLNTLDVINYCYDDDIVSFCNTFMSMTDVVLNDPKNNIQL